MSDIDPVLQQTTITVRQLSPFTESLPRCRAMCRDGTQCMFSARFTQDDIPICGQHLGRPSLLFVKPRRGW